MTRSASRRSSAVQAEKSPAAPPTSAPHSEAPATAPQMASLPWTWGVVMFLWITSFIGLLIYEWLAGILKSW